MWKRVSQAGVVAAADAVVPVAGAAGLRLDLPERPVDRVDARVAAVAEVVAHPLARKALRARRAVRHSGK